MADRMLKTKWTVFLLLGLLILFLAWALSFFVMGKDHQAEFWVSLAQHICSAIIAVAIVGVIWKRVGGEPLEIIITQLKRAVGVSKRFDRMGIEKFWLARDNKAIEEMKNEYLKKIPKSKQIDLMALTLSHILKDPTMRTAICNAIIKKRVNVRILLSDPEMSNPVTVQRKTTTAEKGEAVFETFLRDAITDLGNLHTELTEARQNARLLSKAAEKLGRGGDLEVRLASKHVIYCMVIRLGDDMYVCNYFSGLVGEETPAMHIRNTVKKGLFRKYADEFAVAFNDGREFHFPNPRTITSNQVTGSKGK